MPQRLSLVITLLLFIPWMAITIVGALVQAGGTTALDELASSGIVVAIPAAAAFLLLATALLRSWPSVGLTRSRANRALLVPSLAVAALLILAVVNGLPVDDVLLLLIVNTAFVGISEELAFRGVVLSALLGRFTTRRAVLLGALLFGAVHSFNALLTGETVQAVSQSVIAVGMGIWAGALRVKTGSLLGPMLLHALWDLSLFCILAAGTGSTLATGASVLAILFVIVLAIWGYKQLGRDDQRTQPA